MSIKKDAIHRMIKDLGGLAAKDYGKKPAAVVTVEKHTIIPAQEHEHNDDLDKYIGTHHGSNEETLGDSMEEGSEHQLEAEHPLAEEHMQNVHSSSEPSFHHKLAEPLEAGTDMDEDDSTPEWMKHIDEEPKRKHFGRK